MASEDSRNSQHLVVGSLVSFTSKIGEFYQGTVDSYNADDSSFRINAVSRTKSSAAYNRVEGYYQFSFKDIKDLKVIRLPAQKSTTTNTKDDQKPNPGPGDASSSSSASTSI